MSTNKAGPGETASSETRELFMNGSSCSTWRPGEVLYEQDVHKQEQVRDLCSSELWFGYLFPLKFLLRFNSGELSEAIRV